MYKDGWTDEDGKEGTLGNRTVMSILNLPLRHISLLKPYIEFYTDYLQKNYQDKLER